MQSDATPNTMKKGVPISSGRDDQIGGIRIDLQDALEKKRHAPAPDVEAIAEDPATAEDHEQRQEETERHRRLDPARVQPALAVGRMLRDIRRRAAVLTAEREPLKKPEHDQCDRRRDTDRRVARQHADEGRRGAHDDDRHEERVFAADQIAEPTEQQRTERANEKSRGEREQREDESRRLAHAGEGLLRDDGRQRAV